MSLLFVDVEAGAEVINGTFNEFGVVEYDSREWFHGVLTKDRMLYRYQELGRSPESGSMFWVTKDAKPNSRWSFNGIQHIVFRHFDDWLRQFSAPYIFVSDNPAFDWMWMNTYLHRYLGYNPFGHSARRIGDFYAGLVGDWRAGSKWKKYRRTTHDHHPVHDAMGNVEAFRTFTKGKNLNIGGII